ncbi:hypothetical protein HDC30_002470 [Pseudomonas sp. JAI115]|uniref:hypothetical protein n=1 Tax=Pseudomonas sp. JAI115 TaxID=2723061 RepID=UPI00160DA36C|nr:hypothetical protein [Pseudomonas sp. JAI115]MBB6155247.1 hypothetical protein [Pseudomonas sp. JAI115]
MSKTVYQINGQGLYVGPLQLPEAPPAGVPLPHDCITTPPPSKIPPLTAACWIASAGSW